VTNVFRQLPAVVAAILLLTACSGAPEPVAQPSPSTTPTPTAAPKPTPPPDLAGERTVFATLVSNVHLLAGQPVPAPDEDAINALIARTADLLDAHLRDLNAGGPGLLAELAPDGMFATAAEADVIGTDLANQDEPAMAARYVLDVAYDEIPRFIRVRVEVDWLDGSTAAIDLALTPDDPAQLLMAGVAS